jgi:hypothetical protein
MPPPAPVPPAPDPDTATPLILGEAEPFGVGGRRLCYVHPTDPGKCVKVLRHDDQRTVRLAKTRFKNFRREYDNNTHEMRILLQLEKTLGGAMAQHLPRCYGMHPTDKGPGLVLDLVRDHDGRISRSVRELITLGKDLALLRPAFDELGAFLLRHRIVTRHIHDHNIAASDHGDGRFTFYIIDGLGDPAWLPFRRWCPPLARAGIQKRLDRAWPRFEALAAKGGVSRDLIENSSWDQGMLRHRD